MAPIALAFAVLDATGSVGSLGLVVGAHSLTSILFLLYGGVLADRLPRGPLLVGSSVVHPPRHPRHGRHPLHPRAGPEDRGTAARLRRSGASLSSTLTREYSVPSPVAISVMSSHHSASGGRIRSEKGIRWGGCPLATAA
ncbi:hypothetical protein ACM01_28615 [Streptomyces viridochromogenes]|uniref:Major facilitator superfamily (MFS) profile domain-containing protein n=1 Tax=Streptomyces viridochromogenes TaxID=1938 RepID=A0A0J8C0I4_STRVR|nr:hypothetical protein ACM01_28615 [Streptomyces viridochromogenes]